MKLNGDLKNVWLKGRFMVAAGATLTVSALLTGCTWDHVQPDVCFESDVLPVVRNYCGTSGCHDSQSRVEGYDFTNYQGIMQAVSPKHPGSSKLIEAIRGWEEPMPPRGYPQPSGTQVATIEAWIKSGAANTTGCNTVTCDTSAAVTYSGDIQPMISTYCGGCHGGSSPSAGLDLNSFTVVKDNVVNGRIQGSMTGDPNYVSMPPNSALLPSCYVTKIEQWLAEGTPDN
ncbi:MAG: c-type cytochrome domain-containing protein [Bacteroidia bacterium]